MWKFIAVNCLKWKNPSRNPSKINYPNNCHALSQEGLRVWVKKGVYKLTVLHYLKNAEKGCSDKIGWVKIDSHELIVRITQNCNDLSSIVYLRALSLNLNFFFSYCRQINYFKYIFKLSKPFTNFNINHYQNMLFNSLIKNRLCCIQ